MRRLLSLVVVTALLVGSLQAQGKDAERTPLSLLPQGPPLSAEQLEAITDRMAVRMSAVRGLKLPGPVAKAVHARDELRKIFEAKLDEELPAEELARWSEAYQALGLLPRGTDLRSVLVAVMGEQLAGAYDSDTETMLLCAGTPAVLLGPILVHELTHAAQDAHFDLDSLPLEQRENDDLALAVRALVEGDATAVMFDFLVGRDTSALGNVEALLASGPQLTGSPQLAVAPRFLRELLIFPYVGGLRLVSELRREGGWERVNAAYRDLPLSTEQVLHPGKFRTDRDTPQRVVLPELGAAEGSVLLQSNVLGEFGLRQLLEEFTTTEEALRASAGWDGDRFQVWRRKGASTDEGPAWLIVLVTTWDSPADAREFYDAYSHLITNKYLEEEELAAEGDSGRRWRTERGLVELALRGSDVLVVEGVREGERESLWRTLAGYDKEELRCPAAEAAASE